MGRHAKAGRGGEVPGGVYGAGKWVARGGSCSPARPQAWQVARICLHVNQMAASEESELFFTPPSAPGSAGWWGKKSRRAGGTSGRLNEV